VDHFNKQLYSNESFADVINYLLGASGVAASGDTVGIQSGTYTIDGQCIIGKSGVFVECQAGVNFIASTAVVNSPKNPTYCFRIDGNNVTVSNLNLDGSGALMSCYPGVKLPVENDNNGEMISGLGIYGLNCLIFNSIIHNCRVNGVEIFGSHSGAANCKVYGCGANGIGAYFPYGGSAPIDSYIVNNEVWSCGDVGIDIQAISTKVTGNYVHDCDPTHCTIHGFVDSFWGIGVEAYGGTTSDFMFIAENTVDNCVGSGLRIVNGYPDERLSDDYILITRNNIKSNAWCNVGVSNSSNSIISYNTVTGNVGVFNDANCHAVNSAAAFGKQGILESGKIVRHETETAVAD
jgi:hypothetical protein